MRILHLILYIIAAVCFFVAFIAPGVAVTDGPRNGLHRYNLVAAGLFAWVLVPLTALIDDMAND